MGFCAERDAVMFGAPHQGAQFIKDLLIGRFVIGYPAGPDIDDGDAGLDRGLHGALHQVGIARGLLHRQQLELVCFGQAHDLRRALLPAR